LKIGFHLPQVGPLASGENLRAAAQTVEEAGFDSVWVSEHIVIPRKRVSRYPGSPSGEFPLPPDTPFLDSLSTLHFVAACTQRVQLGTSACILPWRNPVITAKELATLDVLSNGRLILGVGAGWWAEEFAMLGVPFEHRGSRLSEYIQLLKALWTEQNPSFHGRFWQIEEVGFSPKPAQKPHPPIWIGGDGEAAFRRVARLGDTWHAAFNQPEQLAEKYARIQNYAREAGRDPQSVGLTVRTSAPTDTPQAIERLGAYAEAGVSHVALELWANSIDNFREVVGRYAREVRPEVA
jgi:probable F420-dependent oxidoreductase